MRFPVLPAAAAAAGGENREMCVRAGSRRAAAGARRQGRSRDMKKNISWRKGTTVMLPVRFRRHGRSTQGVTQKTAMTDQAVKIVAFMGAVKVDRPLLLCYIKGCEALVFACAERLSAGFLPSRGW